MKAWLETKRAVYLNRILKLKAGPETMKPCSRCGVGRPVWQCMDCMDKTAVCVLCCQSAHKLELFHRIQKWNGRHYQQGALWQVGVKIYTDHNGSPCPRSLSSLYGLQPSRVPQGLAGNILAEIAAEHNTVRPKGWEKLMEKGGMSKKRWITL